MFERIAITIFCVGFCLIGTWDFALRMAGMHGDDGPIFYAYAFRDSTLFEGDFPLGFPLSVLVPVKVITSAMIWIPAMLWDKLNVDPYVSAWAMTFAQGFLFGISTYYFALASAEDRFLAFLSMIFAFIAGIWGWNPANYGSSLENMFQPYPANLALAPILFAFTCILRGREGIAFVFLALGGLIHPTVTLYACAILMVYWLLQGIRERSFDFWRKGVFIVVVVLIAVSPAMLATVNLPIKPLPPVEIIDGMRQNQHIFPWNFEGRWTFSVTTTILWTVLGILSLRWKDKFSPKVYRLYVASLIGSLVLGGTHLLGALVGNPMLLNLIGLRSFLWVAFLSLPLVINYWYRHILQSGIVGAIIGMLSLALPLLAYEYGLFWPLVLAGLLLDISQGRLSALRFALSEHKCGVFRVMAGLVVALWSMGFLGIDALRSVLPSSSYDKVMHIVWGVRGSVPGSLERWILIAGVLGIAVFLKFFPYRQWNSLPTSQAKRQPPFGVVFRGLLLSLYGCVAIYVSWAAAEELRASRAVFALDVQNWAREKTPVSSRFVVPLDSWRTMSLRRALSPFTRESYAYVVTEEQKEHRARLLAFYGIGEEEARAWRGNRILREERRLFREFREKDFLRFATEFGATHLVLPKDTRYGIRDLSLPKVYDNKEFAIYGLRN
jgi:hypothetical protein